MTAIDYASDLVLEYKNTLLIKDYYILNKTSVVCAIKAAEEVIRALNMQKGGKHKIFVTVFYHDVLHELKKML